MIWNIHDMLVEELNGEPDYLKMALGIQKNLRITAAVMGTFPIIIYASLVLGFFYSWVTLISLILFTASFVVFMGYQTRKHWWLRRGPIVQVRDIHSWNLAGKWLEESKIPHHEVYTGTYKIYNARHAVLFKLTWG